MTVVPGKQVQAGTVGASGGKGCGGQWVDRDGWKPLA